MGGGGQGNKVSDCLLINYYLLHKMYFLLYGCLKKKESLTFIIPRGTEEAFVRNIQTASDASGHIGSGPSLGGTHGKSQHRKTT